MVKKTIGKNTLGDNNKMKVAMRDYERSTHNLSNLFQQLVWWCIYKKREAVVFLHFHK